MMLRGSLVTPNDATQPTTPYLIRKSDNVVLVPFTELSSMVPDWDAGKAPDVVLWYCGTGTGQRVGSARLLGLLGAGRFAVDFLDLDVLAANGPADGFLPLARLLAQRNFLNHTGLLGNHRLFGSRGHLNRTLPECLVGIFRLQGALDPATLDVDVLFLESHGFL